MNVSSETGKIHTLTLSGRKTLNMSGVLQVKTAQETRVVLATVNGDLVITGTEIHITRFSTDEGALSLEGNINAFGYSDTALNETEKKSFVKKLLK